MHPGPMNRGVEIDSDVADGPYSVILEQVANGVAVRMAVLYLLVGTRSRSEPSMSTEGGWQMKLMLKGGRVIDPANGRDGEFDVLIEDGRIARIGKDLPADGAEVFEVKRGLDRRARADRHPRAPARAGPGAQGDDRHRHRVGGRRRVHRGRLHAEHRSGERPRRHHRVHPEEGGRGAARARLSDRRGLDGSTRRAAGRARRAEGRRLRRVHRRRPAGGDARC